MPHPGVMVSRQGSAELGKACRVAVALVALFCPALVELHRTNVLARPPLLPLRLPPALAQIDVAMLWDQPKADFAILFSITNFNLQSMLNQMSIPATLGP